MEQPPATVRFAGVTAYSGPTVMKVTASASVERVAPIFVAIPLSFIFAGSAAVWLSGGPSTGRKKVDAESR